MGPMCFLTAKDEQGEGLVKKETWWVTNSPCIAAELDRECTNVNKPAPLGFTLRSSWRPSFVDAALNWPGLER